MMIRADVTEVNDGFNVNLQVNFKRTNWWLDRKSGWTMEQAETMAQALHDVAYTTAKQYLTTQDCSKCRTSIDLEEEDIYCSYCWGTKDKED